MTPATFHRSQLLIAIACMTIGLLLLSSLAWAQTPATLATCYGYPVICTEQSVLFPLPVPETRLMVADAPKPAPWWVTSLAVAGPLADGLSTHYTLGHPGTREGNPFFSHLFGSNVTRNEILAFKVAQAALVGGVVRYDWHRNRERAVLVLAVNLGIGAVATGINLKAARRAKSP